MPVKQPNQHNRIIGRAGEELATIYLREKGFTILERNVRTKFGEIDIVATNNGILYCVEVKTRTNTAYGFPHEAITPKKLQRMLLTAQMFAQKLNYYGEIKLYLAEVIQDKVTITELEL